MLCPACQLPLPRDSSDCPRCALTHALALGKLDPSSASPEGIEGYELLHELGRGAMGVVWLARERKLDRLVALKLLVTGANPQFAQRLLREGQSAARLRHPHIVAVHALGRSETGAFLAMDFLEGGNLDEHLAGKPIPPRRTAELVAKLADALAHAHASGLLHRDLKPSNILLDAAGEPHLADFGLAAPLEGSGDLTLPGQVAGTPAYLAPELLAGVDRASPPSDVYGLGAILYVCLTGRAPFIGDSTAAILAQLKDADPPAPRLLQPGVPRDLETICLKCLGKSPAARYATAELLRDDLTRFLRGKTIHARPAGTVEKTFRWCRRHPAAATSVGLATTILLLFAVGGPLIALRIDRARRAAEAAHTETVAAEKKTREQLRVSLLAQARATRLNAHQGQRNEALAATAEAARIRPGLDVRDEFIAALATPELTLIREWTARTGVSQRIAFDPDHDRYAVETDPGQLELHRLSDAMLITRFHGPTSNLFSVPTFSADGHWLVARNKQAEVLVWNATRPEPVFRLPNHAYTAGKRFNYGQPDAFSPDGRTLASANPGGGITFHATEDGHELKHIETDAEVTHLVYSPDGTMLAVGTPFRRTEGQFLQITDATTGAEISRPRVDEVFQTLAWSPDSKRLLVASSQIEIYRARDGRRLRALSDSNADSVMPGPNSNLIISVGQNGGANVWNLVTNRHIMTALLGGQPEVAVDRTGTLLAKTSGPEKARLFRFEMPRVVRTVPCETDDHDNVTNNGATLDYSPDGRWIATAAWGGIQLREATSGKVISAVAQGHANNQCSLRFAPDGQALIACSKEIGLVRLPVEATADGLAHFGTAATIDAETNFLLSDVSRDGARALLTSPWNDQVKVVALRGEAPAVRWPLAGAARAVFLADGREVLANSFEGIGRTPLKIMDATTGRELRTLPLTHGQHVRLSPDGNWLLVGVSMAATVLRRTADLSPGPELPAQPQGAGHNTAISRDGRLLAFGLGDYSCLVRVADGAMLAHLETPESSQGVADLAFSPDGRQFAVWEKTGQLTLWDLAALHEELAAHGLDW